MKKVLFCLVGVLIVLALALPAGIPAVMGQGGNNQTAIDETATNSTPLVDDSDDSGCLPCSRARSSGNSSGNQTDAETLTASGNSTLEANGESDGDIGLMQTDPWPRCQSGCDAKDASITHIWLEANPDCTPGTPTSAELWATFNINRSQGVCCVVSVVDIYIDGNLFQADHVTYIGNLVPGGTTYDVKITDITWPCGSVLTLTNIYAQWIQKTGSPCPDCSYTCDDYSVPSKCYYDAGPYEVQAPLVADFEFTTECYCDNTIFTDTTTGGVEPYKSWDWDFGGDYTYEGDDPTTLQNPVIHYDSAGSYNVTLTVTDDDGTVRSRSRVVTVYPTPTADAGPDKDIYEGDSVQIGGNSTASGGTPPYTYSWTPTTGLDDATIANPTASPASTTTYTVTVTDSKGCTDEDSMTVTVKERLTLEITAASDSKVYDGTPLTNDGYSITDGTLADGHTLVSVTVTGSQTDVGSSDNVPSNAVIMDNGTDVTANYDITYVNGTLTVTAREIEITAASDSKVYDGTPLTNDGYSITDGTLADGHTLVSVTVTGSQTDVGSSANVPSNAVIMDNGTDVTANYDITYVNGTLTLPPERSKSPPPATARSMTAHPSPTMATA
jgi:hypothetical protein